MSDREICNQCHGTGIFAYVPHSHTEESVEPIRCAKCDGFGWFIPSIAGEPMSDIQNAFTKEMSLAAMTKTRLVELAPILTNEQFTVFLNALMHYSLKIVDRNSDLLEATRTLLDCFVEDPISWMYKSDIAIEKARDAIAKATGAA